MYVTSYINKFLANNNIEPSVAEAIKLRMDSVTEKTGVLKGREFKSEFLPFILGDEVLIANFNKIYNNLPDDFEDDYLYC